MRSAVRSATRSAIRSAVRSAVRSALRSESIQTKEKMTLMGHRTLLLKHELSL